jgi:hypothetical protein
MILKILLGLVLLLAVLAIIIAMRPDDFRVARSIVIAAPPSAIFPYLNSQRKGAEWAPWNKLDPAMKQDYSGPDSGVGASLAWDGNSQVGAGKSTIIESRPDELVRMRLEFLRPFKGTNTAEFALKPAAGGTEVTWSMEGKAGFMSKAVGLFMDCEKMCGDMFTKGLTDLKELAEGAPRTAALN